LLLPLFVFRVALSQSEEAAAWVTVAPDTGGFSVLMPAKPALETEQAPIAGNKYETNTYSASEAKTGNIYLVITQETPTITQALTTAKRMDQFVEGFKEGFGDSKRKAELTYDRELALDGRYGRQYTFAYAETRGILRAYDSGKRVYVLLALGGDEQTAGIARFLESFKFTTSLPTPPKPVNPPPKP
jgi:hypothetical protein